MKRIALLAFIMVLSSKLDAQLIYPQVFSSFGGNLKNETVQLTWTAGEPLYETVSSNVGILTQGFNQTVYITTDIPDFPPYPLPNLTVFPNPFQGILYVNLPTESSETLGIQLFDMFGRCILIKKTNSNLEELHLPHIANGMYVLRITRSNRILKTFRVAKVE